MAGDPSTDPLHRGRPAPEAFGLGDEHPPESQRRSVPRRCHGRCRRGHRDRRTRPCSGAQRNRTPWRQVADQDADGAAAMSAGERIAYPDEADDGECQPARDRRARRPRPLRPQRVPVMTRTPAMRAARAVTPCQATIGTNQRGVSEVLGPGAGGPHSSSLWLTARSLRLLVCDESSWRMWGRARARPHILSRATSRRPCTAQFGADVGLEVGDVARSADD